MKSPARTPGWNGRFGFRLPMVMILSFTEGLPSFYLEYRSFDDVDAALAVDQVAQTPIVGRDVVGGGEREPLRRVCFVVRHLARGERIGDVENPQSFREPREWDDGALEALGGLMTAHHRGLRCAIGIQAFDLERR